MRILVTGGTGYIGSHTCVELLERGHDVVVLDNLVNSHRSVLDHVSAVAGRAPVFVEADVRDAGRVADVLSAYRIEAVLHFAALKAVGESWSYPLEYYDTNVGGTLALLGAMRTSGVSTLVFSSTATVYGEPDHCPVGEDAPRVGVNPYGRTKLMVEHALEDLDRAWPELRVAVLRYFNPVGAHPSGQLGEDPRGTPNNLMPLVALAAAGHLERLQVFGDDYPTPDGTGVRDYIHVVDLAQAHVEALGHLVRAGESITLNLGTGRGYSVLEVIRAFERASGRVVPYEVVARRPGDAARSYADPTRANALLGWKARLGLDAMCEDAWRWRQHLDALQ
ncbi:UDP-glucose 4-epimerase GalE [Cognatilysobacter segetis]|uniref:UDP-glucose 4-epimerase GalE n=1 Tax=Cognatilysobacter segetis TaxID=2492394 RepID=UPI00105DB718|nr:UDP-glucose 4-epimerase GalE [Lysobacter segetis]